MTTGDGVSRLKLSDPKGTADKGNAALGVPSIEDQVADRIQLAETNKRIKELERNNAELQKVLDQVEKQEPQAKSKAAPGKARHVAHAEGWKAVCTAPDLCKVGKAVVAFNSFATLDQKQTASPDVKARGTPVYRKGDVIKNVQADAGKHIVSGTSLGKGHVKILEGHENVKVNGVPVARHDSRCLINCDSSGVGGAQGKLVTEQKSVGGSVSAASNPTAPPGERTSEKLEALKKARERVSADLIDFDASDQHINFQRSNEILDGLISQISGEKGSSADYLAQGARGLLGFGKDVVMGVGELAYEGAKAVPKILQLGHTHAGQLHAQLDAQILAENIKLGNITAGTVGRSALDIGKAIIKPITDPWGKGQYVESVTRAATEVGSIGLGWLKGGKATGAAKASNASNATDAASVVASKHAPDVVAAKPRGMPAPSASSGVHVKANSKPAFSGDWGNYVTHGIKADPMSSPEGRRMVAEYEKQGLRHTEAVTKTRDLMQTGSSLPYANPIETGDKFYKVIPQDGSIGQNSAFWATKEEVLALEGLSYDQIADKLGIPLVSQQGAKFSVMEITALRNGTSFTSVIAPTTELGANGAIWSQSAGGLQTLLIDRSIFTAPVPTNIKLP